METIEPKPSVGSILEQNSILFCGIEQCMIYRILCTYCLQIRDSGGWTCLLLHRDRGEWKSIEVTGKKVWRCDLWVSILEKKSIEVQRICVSLNVVHLKMKNLI